MTTDRISALLSLRDAQTGSPADIDNVTLGDADAELLARLEANRAALRNLPTVPAGVTLDDAAWRQYLPPQADAAPAKTGGAAGRAWLRFPLASAAAAFVISVVGVLLVFQGVQTLQEAPESQPLVYQVGGEGDQQRAQLIALMNRSVELEQAVYGVGGWRVQAGAGSTRRMDGDDLRVSALGQYILFQLAQVDGELAALHELSRGESTPPAQDAPASADTETAQTAARVALWQQRVNLLQAFVADMAQSNPGDYQDTRSM